MWPCTRVNSAWPSFREYTQWVRYACISWETNKITTRETPSRCLLVSQCKLATETPPPPSSTTVDRERLYRFIRLSGYWYTRQVGCPGLRVSSHLALTYIHQMNRVNSRNDLRQDNSTINIVPGIIITHTTAVGRADTRDTLNHVPEMERVFWSTILTGLGSVKGQSVVWNFCCCELGIHIVWNSWQRHYSHQTNWVGSPGQKPPGWITGQKFKPSALCSF